MTVSEAINNFNLYYDQKTGAENPGLLDEEVKQILQDSQMDLIGDKGFGDNFQGPGFESNQRRVSELEHLVKNSSLTAVASTYLDYECTLPTGETGFMYYNRSRSKLNRSDYPSGTGLYYRNIFVKHEWADNFDDYGKKTHYLEPRVTIENGKLFIKVDSFTTGVTSVRLTYIRKPADITNLATSDTIDLPQQLYDQLIQVAVRKASGTNITSDGKYQVQSIEEQKTTD